VGHGIEVTTEPNVPGTSRRNDIRVTNGDIAGIAPADFEIKVHALTTHANLASYNPDPSATAFLTKCEESARANRPIPPSGHYSPPMSPIVFSAGGLLAPASRNAILAWRRHIKASTFQFIMRLIAFSLLRSRARLFTLG